MVVDFQGIYIYIPYNADQPCGLGVQCFALQEWALKTVHYLTNELKKPLQVWKPVVIQALAVVEPQPLVQVASNPVDGLVGLAKQAMQDWNFQPQDWLESQTMCPHGFNRPWIVGACQLPVSTSKVSGQVRPPS